MTPQDGREVLTMYTPEEAIAIGPDEANLRARVAIANLLDQLYRYWPNAVEAWVSARWRRDV